MASRPEMVQCCQELGIDHTNMTTEDMMAAVRAEADARFANKDHKVSADSLSDSLKRFLTKEYNFKILDKEGNEIDF